MVDFFGEDADDHIVSHCVGDHMEAQSDGTSSFSPQHTPKAVTSTAYYYFDTWIVAQAAEILGKTEDARRYTELAEKIKAAFNREFLNQDTNEYSTGSQTSNAMALYFDMVPEGRQEAVLKNLVDDILIDHNGHLSTGIIGTNALEQVLGKHGRADVMYTIASQTTVPSWGHQVLKGHTTLCETWECETEEPQLSYNMAMFGSTEVFFYRDLAGISPSSPGYKNIKIAPQVVGDLTYASGSLKTVRGLVSSSWKKNVDGFTLEVTIPVNSTAKVSVPTMALKNIEVAESNDAVWKEGKFIKSSPGVTNATRTKDYVTFDVGSGTYTFKLTGDVPKPALLKYTTDEVTFVSDFDGTEQGYAIMTPANASGRVRDLMLVLHGHGADRWQYINDPRGECAASRDVAIENKMIYVSPDYRITNWMGAAAEADVVKIIKDLKEKYRIGKVFITGASMGGGSCLTFAALHPDLIDGVASLNGMANYFEYVEYENIQLAIRQSFGGTKAEVTSEYKKRSAEYWPENFTMPIGITAGGQDAIVPPDSVLRLANILELLGRDIMLIYNEDGGHETNYDDSKAVLEFVIQKAGKVNEE